MKSSRILPPKFLAAMIAVLPLPDSPLYDGDDPKVMEQDLADLEIYKKSGVDSVIFENDHDLPYIQPPLDEGGIALMTNIVRGARQRFVVQSEFKCLRPRTSHHWKLLLRRIWITYEWRRLYLPTLAEAAS